MRPPLLHTITVVPNARNSNMPLDWWFEVRSDGAVCAAATWHADDGVYVTHGRGRSSDAPAWGFGSLLNDTGMLISLDDFVH